MSAESDRRFEFYLNKINDLPSLPAIVVELTRLIDNPMVSVNEIESLLARDQGLTLKILKLANSAYYAIPGGAKTLVRAITYVGFASVKQMVLTSTLFKLLETKSADGFDVNDFWKHSVSTAGVAELLAKKFKLGAPPEDAFVCGIVHDMGKIIVRMVEPEVFSQLTDHCLKNHVRYEDAERLLDAPRHTHWGQVLAKKWKLPQAIQSAVRDHHTASVGLRMTQTKDVNDLVDAVYMANIIVDALKSEAPYSIEPEVLLRTGLRMTDISGLQSEIQDAIASVDDLLEALNAG